LVLIAGSDFSKRDEVFLQESLLRSLAPIHVFHGHLPSAFCDCGRDFARWLSFSKPTVLTTAEPLAGYLAA
jgi:hypothetical protein